MQGQNAGLECVLLDCLIIIVNVIGSVETVGKVCSWIHVFAFTIGAAADFCWAMAPLGVNDCYSDCVFFVFSLKDI